MKTATATQLFLASFTTLGYLFLFIIFGLFLDSRYMVDGYIPKQDLATLVMLVGFAVLFYKSGARIREQMIYAVIIGILGEYLFSIGLGMYTYRLGNIPHYVPPGHAIVLIATMSFCKKPIIKVTKIKLEKSFTIFIFIYSLASLIYANDIFGFVMSMAVIYLLRNKPRERLFYLSMYLVVVFLELVGTSYECWRWPDTAWGVLPFLKSANPPSGISLFYFLLDLGCLWFYKQRNMEAWKRMKSIRLIREEKIAVS